MAAAADVTAPSTLPSPGSAPFERLWLDETSWVDVARDWLGGSGIDAHEMTDGLLENVAWKQGRLWRYERWVDEPRLGGSWRVGGTPPHPALPDLHRGLQSRYGVRFDVVAFALYRDGRDSVAFHRDRELRWLDDTVIAVLTLGERRPWLLRPRSRRYDHEAPLQGAVHDLAPASGDLLVLGGRCQADWEHSVPKVAHRIGARVSLQWRWTSRRGRPEQGPGYRAPRHFSRVPRTA